MDSKIAEKVYVACAERDREVDKLTNLNDREQNVDNISIKSKHMSGFLQWENLGK